MERDNAKDQPLDSGLLSLGVRGSASLGILQGSLEVLKLRAFLNSFKFKKGRYHRRVHWVVGLARGGSVIVG